jgi:hypothetical protein
MYSFVDRDMMVRYHFGLGVGHLYARHAASTGVDEPASECLQPVDISDLELGENDDGIFSELGGVNDNEEDVVSGSEHSLDLSDDDSEDEEDGFNDEEACEMNELYR